jgi:hypothetical protein
MQPVAQMRMKAARLREEAMTPPGIGMIFERPHRFCGANRRQRFTGVLLHCEAVKDTLSLDQGFTV